MLFQEHSYAIQIHYYKSFNTVVYRLIWFLFIFHLFILPFPQGVQGGIHGSFHPFVLTMIL